jgi:hypothetical protein
LYTIDRDRPDICAASSGTPPCLRLRLRLDAVFLYTLGMLFLSSFTLETRRAFDPAYLDYRSAVGGAGCAAVRSPSSTLKWFCVLNYKSKVILSTRKVNRCAGMNMANLESKV